MKTIKYILSAVVLLLAFSCSKESAEPIVEGSVPVRVHVSDFTISVNEFPDTRTRATDPEDYNTVKAITLAFYATDGTEVYKSTQLRSDATTYTTFGDFTFNLPIGSYTMVAMGYECNDGDVFVLTNSTNAGFTSERVRETFCASQSVSVTGTAALNLSVTLNRIVTMLAIYSTDVRPTGVAKVRTTYTEGCKSFNPTTGLAINASGFSMTNTPNQAVGNTIAIGNYSFLPIDEKEMDITLEVLDANDQVLITKVVKDVPLKRNRQTTLRGPIFTPSASSASFLLETTWITGNIVDF